MYSNVNNSAYNSAPRIFGYLDNLLAICTCSELSKTLTPTIFPFPWLSMGLNELAKYRRLLAA